MEFLRRFERSVSFPVASKSTELHQSVRHPPLGFRLKRSLTIIDTPGYQEDSQKNQEITEKIRDFFVGKNYGIREVDAVGLVIKSPSPSATEKFIYQSIVSIFGHKVKKNIKYLFTFGDQQDRPLLKNFSESDLIPLPNMDNFSEIDHFKFVSSAFFCGNRLLPFADRQVIFQCYYLLNCK